MSERFPSAAGRAGTMQLNVFERTCSVVLCVCGMLQREGDGCLCAMAASSHRDIACVWHLRPSDRSWSHAAVGISAVCSSLNHAFVNSPQVIAWKETTTVTSAVKPGTQTLTKNKGEFEFSEFIVWTLVTRRGQYRVSLNAVCAH